MKLKTCNAMLIYKISSIALSVLLSYHLTHATAESSHLFDPSKVVYAVNCGGESFVDSNGIHYDSEDVTVSGFATKSGELIDTILGAPVQDLKLFLTDRTGTEGLRYSIPIKSDGRYVIVIKFVETSVKAAGKRVFDVLLNEHQVLPKLDIFAKVGFGTVFQVVIPFEVSGGVTQLDVSEAEVSEIEDRVITLEFRALPGHDRPKVNAFYVMRGEASDVPSVPVTAQSTRPKSKVFMAINAGGNAYTDTSGIHYSADHLKIGTASSHGASLVRFFGVNSEDSVLYRTERYHLQSFSYKIPVPEDGSYVLVLKFSEVWFQHPRGKVFDVVLNDEHTVVSNLDIFSTAGFATAHDEFIQFKIANHGKMLKWNGETSTVYNKQITLEFRKGLHDNPKVNGFFVFKGTIEDLPRPLPAEHDPELGVETPEFDDWNPAEDEEQDTIIPSKPVSSALPGIDSLSSDHNQRKDPWENESMLTIALPLILTLLIGAVVLGVMYVFMKSPLK